MYVPMPATRTSFAESYNMGKIYFCVSRIKTSLNVTLSFCTQIQKLCVGFYFEHFPNETKKTEDTFSIFISLTLNFFEQKYLFHDCISYSIEKMLG